MLILRRKVGESFLLGDQISVTILELESNGTVSIGINAPKDVLILRSELQQAASANQDSANALSSPEMVKELEEALFQEHT
ncbi:MAG: carbon storage regulator [Lawsonibacter sp.]|jgi:carbon storage regulator